MSKSGNCITACWQAELLLQARRASYSSGSDWAGCLAPQSSNKAIAVQKQASPTMTEGRREAEDGKERRLRPRLRKSKPGLLPARPTIPHPTVCLWHRTAHCLLCPTAVTPIGWVSRHSLATAMFRARYVYVLLETCFWINTAIDENISTFLSIILILNGHYIYV